MKQICDGCGKELPSYADVGYDGPAGQGRPAPENRECSPFQAWLVLCRACASDQLEAEG